MSTTAPKTATAAGPILSIDLGKYKCVAYSYDRATSPADFRSIWVHDWCIGLGIRCGGGEHRVRGVAVPARETEDGPGRAVAPSAVKTATVARVTGE